MKAENDHDGDAGDVGAEDAAGRDAFFVVACGEKIDEGQCESEVESGASLAEGECVVADRE